MPACIQVILGDYANASAMTRIKEGKGKLTGSSKVPASPALGGTGRSVRSG